MTPFGLRLILFYTQFIGNTAIGLFIYFFKNQKKISFQNELLESFQNELLESIFFCESLVFVRQFFCFSWITEI